MPIGRFAALVDPQGAWFTLMQPLQPGEGPATPPFNPTLTSAATGCRAAARSCLPRASRISIGSDESLEVAP